MKVDVHELKKLIINQNRSKVDVDKKSDSKNTINNQQANFHSVLSREIKYLPEIHFY